MTQGANGALTTKEREDERSGKGGGAVFTVGGAGGLPARAGGDDPAEAAGRYKTVTKTFSNLEEEIQIPNSSVADRSDPASPYASMCCWSAPAGGTP